MAKIAVLYGAMKGLAIGLLALGVVANGSLSPDVRAFLVAVVSGILGVVGVILGAKVSARDNSVLLQVAKDNQELAHANQHLLERIEELSRDTHHRVTDKAAAARSERTLKRDD